MTLSAGNDKETGQRAEAAAACVRDLRRRLQFHQALGIDAYPLNEEVRRFLQFTTEPGSPPVQARAVPAAAPGFPPHSSEEGRDLSQLLAALRQEIEQCTLCSLAGSGAGRVQGRGQAGSRLMVVGDWSVQEQGFSPTTLLGAEEDAMLGKMMAAIGLRPEEVYVTNILKCCPPVGQEATPQWWQCCFSFLQREVALIRPRLICAMGELAARMLVGGTEPLIRLRGRLSPYRYLDGEPILVMPTFHPRFLQRNPDMKMAAWKDLQAVQKRLALPGQVKHQ